MAKTDKEIRWPRRGAIGIVSLLAMMVLGTIGAGLIMMTSTEVNTGAQYRDGVAAQYIAEAGARWAAIQLKNKVGTFISDTDSSAGKTYPAVTLGNAPTAGSYSVTIRRDPAYPADSNRRQVVTTATVNSAQRQVDYAVALGGGGLPTQLSGFGQNTILLAGTVEGDIGAANTVTLKYGYSAGTISAKTIVNPDGTTKSGTPPSGQVVATIPTAPVSFDINDASYQQFRSGATTQTPILNNATTTWSGNNYINTNFQIKGSTVLTTTANAGIYANGDISIQNNCTINALGNLTIVSNGAISLSPGKINVAAGSTLTLYAKNGITMDSGSVITGNTTMISPQTVNVTGGSSVIVGNGGVINVYTQANFTASSGMAFKTTSAGNSAAITVISSGNISVTGGSPFNAGTNGTVKLYSAGTFAMSGGASIVGYGQVTAGDTGANSIRVTGGSDASNTVFISAGSVYSSAATGPVYAQGSITFDYGADAHYNAAMFPILGIPTSGSFSISSWSKQ